MVLDPDFDDLEAFGCGEIGLTITEFYDITPREFDNIVRGYKRKAEFNYKDGWEKTRRLAFAVTAPYIPKKDNITLFDFMPLPWDPDKEKKPERTPEQVKNIFERWDKKN